MVEILRQHEFDAEKIARACANRYAHERAELAARVASGLAVAPENDDGREHVYRAVLAELKKAIGEA